MLFAERGIRFLLLNSAWEVDEWHPRWSGIHSGALQRALGQAVPAPALSGAVDHRPEHVLFMVHFEGGERRHEGAGSETHPTPAARGQAVRGLLRGETMAFAKAPTTASSDTRSAAREEKARRPAANEPTSHVCQRSPLEQPGYEAQRQALSPDSVQQAAASGTRGTGGALPHLAAIRKSFGRHDVSNVQAYVGGAAAPAARTMGAEAYATDGRVAFAASPSRHTAAHEAAHVVQQRAGVQLRGGVGQVGDRYEQHADAVANAVVAGRSAEGLLDEMAPATGSASAGAGGAVQHKKEAPKGQDDENSIAESLPEDGNYGDPSTNQGEQEPEEQEDEAETDAETDAEEEEEEEIQAGADGSGGAATSAGEFEDERKGPASGPVQLKPVQMRTGTEETGGCTSPRPKTVSVATFEAQFRTSFKRILHVFPKSFGHLFTPWQRQVLVKFMGNTTLPPSPFSSSDGSKLSAAQKRLVAGAMFVMDRRTAGRAYYPTGKYKWVTKKVRKRGKVTTKKVKVQIFKPRRKGGRWIMRRKIKGANCGDWALRVREYSRGETHRKSWGAGGKPRGAKTTVKPQMQAISRTEFGQIRPGDWIMIKWKRTPRRNNHSVMVVKWTKKSNTTASVEVMDQLDNNKGGGEFHGPWTLSCNPAKPPYVYGFIKDKQPRKAGRRP